MITSKKIVASAFPFFCASILFASCPDAIYRVSTSGTGDGCSWATACSLDYALANAIAGNSIWVKKGTYFRGTLGPVQLERGVSLIGGFAGTETAASQSDPSLNATILDGRTSASNPLPQGRVVESFSDYDPQDPTSGPTLRGFTIANGNAPGLYDNDYGGGGLLLHNSRARIVNCEIRDNRAEWAGAGANVRYGSQVSFINCNFHDNGTGTPGPEPDWNSFPIAGGAVIVWRGFGGPTSGAEFVNCIFFNNTAEEGGAIEALGPTTIMNSTFVNNRAKVTVGGGLFYGWKWNTLLVENSVFYGNTASHSAGGNQIFISPGDPAMLSHTNIQGGWTGPGMGNINSDPIFVNASINDFRIRYNSPCRNTGTIEDFPEDIADLDWDGNTVETLPLDLQGKLRVAQAQVDMGAYETSCAQPPTADCNVNGVPDACDILEGSSLDCNANTVPDSCDIAFDPSKDCFDGNGVPDLCQVIPKGACCLPDDSCTGPETSCRCTALAGAWYQGKKCFQVNCGLGGIE